MKYFLILYVDENVVSIADYLKTKANVKRSSGRHKTAETEISDKACEHRVIFRTARDRDNFNILLEKQGHQPSLFKNLLIVRSNLDLCADGDMLYVVAHGKYSRPDKATQNILYQNNENESTTIDASGLIDLLKSMKLPNLDIKLKLFTCRSGGSRSDVAEIDTAENMQTYMKTVTLGGKISSLLKNTHNRVHVYGYIGATKFNNYKTAGMTENLTKATRAKSARIDFSNCDSPIVPESWCSYI